MHSDVLGFCYLNATSECTGVSPLFKRMRNANFVVLLQG